MPFVPVPKDLAKVKTKVAFNLTKRQIVCFGAGRLVGVPTYIFTRGSIGNELMSTDELAVMDGGKCILQVQGVRPFFSDKFDITRHQQYKYLLDSSKKNAFDIAKYLSRRLTVRPDDVFESCELEAPPASDAPAD